MGCAKAFKIQKIGPKILMRSLMRPEPPNPILAKSRDLEDGFRSGRYDSRFILSTMRSDEWYAAYINLAGRCEDASFLESLVKDMLGHCSLPDMPVTGDPLCCGVDTTGTHVLGLLARRGVAQKDLLSIDNETIARSETPAGCRERAIETPGMMLYSADDKGRSAPLSWGGVHHGSAGYYCLSTLGNLAALAAELAGRSRIALIAHSADEREQGTVSALVALTKALGVPATVYTALPIKFKQFPEFCARAKDAVEKWEKMTRVTALDPETVMKDENFRTMSLEAFFAYTEQWITGRILEDLPRAFEWSGEATIS